MMEIRPMCELDTAQIARLETACFSDPWSEKSIATELENPLSLWLVAVEQNEVVGYIGSQTVLDGADLMNVAVAPAFRRKGIAEKLILTLISQLRERGALSLSLEVRVSNRPAAILYQKLGFQVVGIRPGYYRHPKEDACIMRKEWEL